ncbi:type II toxin-antitoxin system toxin DNA ADP-ribosyl transferase DarT [Spirosoma panaciterrae]|uniref:type II toxin-antitoxin system toxin DNA ADP-ribosyl transferase DarT n=1 Tax=Spirosoma panaciterrae TaxID=496058 RepID=UPI000475B653|nr:DUF4433 domain-containing protein [Spirosoma panaciterrae]
MSLPVPEPVWIHRIVHEQNLPDILRHGMFCRRAIPEDPNYIFIGDNQLTQDRHEYPVPLENYGNLGDYVPFYFGPLSPMLLNIKTGHRGITKRPQEEIIYISCKVDSIVKAGLRFVFTDGQAKDRLTVFYQSLDDLDKIDWEVVKAKYWHNTEDDWDRQRRKQAEFLVYEKVTANLIDAIVVFNKEKADFVNGLLKQEGRSIPVYINPGNRFYY